MTNQELVEKKEIANKLLSGSKWSLNFHTEKLQRKKNENEFVGERLDRANKEDTEYIENAKVYIEALENYIENLDNHLQVLSENQHND